MNCFECGRTAEHQHHVIPKSLGGTKTVPLCLDCHAKAHERGGFGHSALIRAGQQKRFAAGLPISKRPPYGTDLVDGRLVVNLSEMAVIESIVLMRDEGRSLRAIASDLAQRGIRPKLAARWNPNVIKKIYERWAA